MMGPKKFDQQRAREVVHRLRLYAQHGDRLTIKQATDAADIIEDLALAVFGIQEVIPLESDRHTD